MHRHHICVVLGLCAVRGGSAVVLSMYDALCHLGPAGPTQCTNAILCTAVLCAVLMAALVLAFCSVQ